MTERCILILLDGLGDRGYPELGGKTPLQAAKTPNLDYLAAQGACGLLSTCRYGVAPPSENAHLSLFGYVPSEMPGRGLLEALGAGVPVSDNEVAILAHFAAVRETKGSLLLEKDRPKSESEEVKGFCQSIQYFEFAGKKISYYPTYGLDGIIRIGPNGSAKITDTFPFYEGSNIIEPQAWEGEGAPALETAAALKAYLIWAHQTLKNHPLNLKRAEQAQSPLNFLVTLRAGCRQKVQSFSKRWGLKAMTIAAGIVYKGMADYIGIDHLAIPAAKDPGCDLSLRLTAALAADASYNFIHVHSKAPDVAAHTKKVANKVRAIESLDRGLIEYTERLAQGRETVIVTADHSTPSSGPLIHSGEPVPIMVCGPGGRQDMVRKFDEISCASGALGHLRGEDFMYMVLNALNKTKLQGLMDTVKNQPFWPGERKSFEL